MSSAAPCILHVDVDAFFAAVEQRDDARLRGRPVAVGTGVVASCSYEAKRQGVRTGMRLTEARRLCRGLVVLPGDYRRYEQSARRVLAVCHDKTAAVELAALDDLYLDLTPAGAGAPRLAREVGDEVFDEVKLSVSMGMGVGKVVAAVATEQAKRDKRAAGGPPRPSLVGVPAGAERDYLAPWPAEVLPGVGPKVRERLGRVNVHTAGEVAAMPL